MTIKTDDRNDKHNTSLWRESLLKLPDSIFFYLVEKQLGKIASPYHKPKIITRLQAEIKQKISRDNPLKHFSRAELFIIKVIDHFSGLSFVRLIELLREQRHALPLFAILHDLCEQLWLLPVYTGNQPIKLLLNPQLAALLAIDNTPPENPPNRDDISHGASLSPDTLLTAFITLLVDRQIEFIAESGTIKKKDAVLLAKKFPVLLQKNSRGQSLAAIFHRLLKANNLLDKKSGSPKYPAIIKLLALPQPYLILLANITAAWITDTKNDQPQPLAALRLLKSMAYFLRRVKQADEKRLVVALQIIAHKLKIRLVAGNKLLDILIDNFFLTPTQTDNRYKINAALISIGDFPSTQSPALHGRRLTSTFELTIAAPDNNHWPYLPYCASLQKLDNLTIYRFSESKVVTLLKKIEYTTLLASLSHVVNEIPASCLFHLQNWHDKARSIQMTTLIAVTVPQNRQGVIRQNSQLMRWLIEEPRPGLFLFAAAEYADWLPLLKLSGFDHADDILEELTLEINAAKNSEPPILPDFDNITANGSGNIVRLEREEIPSLAWLSDLKQPYMTLEPQNAAQKQQIITTCQQNPESLLLIIMKNGDSSSDWHLLKNPQRKKKTAEKTIIGLDTISGNKIQIPYKNVCCVKGFINYFF